MVDDTAPTNTNIVHCTVHSWSYIEVSVMHDNVDLIRLFLSPAFFYVWFSQLSHRHAETSVRITVKRKPTADAWFDHTLWTSTKQQQLIMYRNIFLTLFLLASTSAFQVAVPRMSPAKVGAGRFEESLPSAPKRRIISHPRCL